MHPRHKGLTIGIGFDQREAVAYHTLCQSILSRSSIPVNFIPIKRTMLRGIHDRPIDPTQSNEFTYTRYLLPYLCDFSGTSLFIDCDMLVRCDIAEILDFCDPLAAVHVVKHDYTPKTSVKYLGNANAAYPRKNWSSVMLFNNYLCKALTPEYVNTATAQQLHRFEWADDERIGELPREWNHLVMEYEENPQAKIVHFTVGGPYFDEYSHCEYSEEWFNMRQQMLHCEQLQVPKTRVSGK